MREITDRESLEEWLQMPPREGILAIAARTAPRVWPFLIDVLVKDQRHRRKAIILPCCRAMLVATFAGKWPKRAAEIGMAAINARIAAREAAVVAGVSTFAANSAVRAIYKVVSAVDATHRADAAVYTAEAAEDASSANHAAAFTASPSAYASSAADAARAKAWKSVHHDISQIQAELSFSINRGMTKDILMSALAKLMQSPLWPDEAPFESESRQLHHRLLSTEATPEGWTVWTDWYDNILEGRHWPEDAAFEIAILPEKDWDQGPAHVNAKIAAILDKHSPKPKPPDAAPVPEQNPHGARWNLRDGRLKIVPTSDEIGDKAHVLQPLAISALTELVEEIGASNQFSRLADKAKKALEIAERQLPEVNQDCAELWSLSVWLGSFAERDDKVRADAGSFSDALGEDQRIALDAAIRQTAAFTRQFKTALELDLEDASFRRVDVDVAAHAEIFVEAHRFEIIDDEDFETMETLVEAADGPAIQAQKSSAGVVFSARNLLIGIALSCVAGVGGLTYASLDQLREIAVKGFAKGARVEQRFEQFGHSANPAIDKVLKSSPPDVRNGLAPILSPRPPPRP